MDALTPTAVPSVRLSSVPSASRADRLRQMPLEPWLEVGDPLAEAVVRTLRARHLPLSQPLQAMRRLAAEGEPACAALLHDMETPPAWADFEAMGRGGAMGYRHFLQLSIALIHGGLMTTFSTADAARILSGTNRLEQNVVRRLFESATLFFGVLDTEALRPGGSAWEICLRVRLMHAMVRLRLLDGGHWDGVGGQPINAMHTAAGPLFFGAMVLERLKKLGGSFSAAEGEGYYLLWRYVTRLLGVPDGLLGDTRAEQEILDARILPYAFNPDANSRRLAEALLSGLRYLPNAERVPRVVHEVLVREMLGEAQADCMGIALHPRGARLARGIMRGFKLYGWMLRLPGVSRLSAAFGRRFMERLVERGLAGVAADFQPH